MHYIKPTAKGLIFMCLALAFTFTSFSQTPVCVDYNERILTQFNSPDMLFIGKGDFNGDGLEDMIANKAYNQFDVYFGKSAFTDFSPNQSFFYTNLLSPGDLNKDNYDDIIVINEKSLLIYYGSDSGLVLKTDYTVNFEDQYNVIISGGDDFNNDGFADFIINAKSNIDPVNGSVYVYHGSAEGPVLNSTTTGNDLNVELYPLKYVGDVNNDNYPDVAMPLNNDLVIFYGTEQGFNATKKTSLPTINGNIFNGKDINGDGFDDILVITQQMGIQSPSATIFLGSTQGAKSTPDYRYVNPRYNMEDEYNYGFNGGPLGDINKDGYEDFYISGGSSDYTEIFLGKTDVKKIQPDYKIRQLTTAMISIDVNNDNDQDMVGSFVGSLYSEIYLGIIESKDNQYLGNSCPASEVPLATYFGDKAMSAGDMNKDGYDDFVITIFDIDPDMGREGTGYVISGGPNGQGKTLFNLGYYKSMGDAMSQGDVNGDGYGDIYFGSELYRSENKESRGIIFSHFGKPGEQDNTLDFQVVGAEEQTYLGGRIAKGGDINGDGFDDILTQSFDRSLLFYGGPTGPDTMPSWSNTEYVGVFGVGDINNDGFSDFFATKGMDNTLFFGSADGPVKSNFIVNGATNYLGDINHDGFDDALLSEFYPPLSPMKILLGNSNGYTDANLVTNKYFIPVDDFNGDGIDDVMASVKYQDENFERTRVEIFFGTNNGLKDTADMIFYPAGTSESLYAVSGIGDINNDGKDDIALRQGNNNIQIYLGRGNEIDSCLTDKTPPVITAPSTQVKCSGPGNVTIPELIATDNCTIQSVSYVITGSTSRLGSGNNATGQFNKGISTITWTVTDLAGNTATAIQQVKVEQELHASIPKAYQINATQSAPYTIYLGYANNTIRLVAWESRTKGPYRYKWSNGDTARYTKVKHNTPGKYNHKVIISNEFGCSDTAYTTITVVDNYCLNPLKDFISQYFPQYLNDPFVQSLLMATSQSYVCINGNTQCVPTGSLKNYINSGAKLGKCGSIPNAANLKATEEITLAEVLNITASPNPSSYEFNLKISGTKGKPYSLRIYNNTGALVMQKHNLTQDFIRTGSTLQKGIYVAEVIQGNQRKSIRLLKIK